jgi:hypothetical protein
MSQQVNDPWDMEEEPEVGPKVYFGEVYLTRNEMYWDRDSRQLLPFDPRQHRVENKLHQVKLGAICTKRDGSTYDLDRDDIIEWPPSPWPTIANKSLHKLGVHYTELDKGRWARWEMIKTGVTFKSKTTGETVEKDFFSFLEFYPDEASCRAAEAAFYNRSRDETAGTGEDPLPMPEDPDKERADAAVFLPTMWTLAQGDPDAFYAAIANQPSLAKFFDSNSPEVVAIVEEAA